MGWPYCFSAIMLLFVKRSNNADICKNLFACLFVVHNTISLSCHEQVCLIRLHFERYFSYHQEEVSRDTSPISHYRYSLYLDIHSWTLRTFSFALNLSSWFSKIAAPCCFKTCHTYIIKKDYLNLFWLIASPKDWLKAYQLAKKNLQQFF